MAMKRAMPKKKQAGRPPKDPEDRRTRLVKTLVTDVEYEELAAAAERDGRTVSDWFRWVGLREARRSGAE